MFELESRQQIRARVRAWMKGQARHDREMVLAQRRTAFVKEMAARDKKRREEDREREKARQARVEAKLKRLYPPKLTSAVESADLYRRGVIGGRDRRAS
jgi:hypothetical protein